jgi:probable phosphoglycerate mutase
MNEIDFGAWTGRSFAALRDDPHWRRWNLERAWERPPGGESMREVQLRASACLDRLAEAHPDAAIAAVSHGDVIRSVVAAVLGLPLDHYARFEVAPASVTTIARWRGGAMLVRLNEGLAA